MPVHGPVRSLKSLALERVHWNLDKYIDEWTENNCPSLISPHNFHGIIDDGPFLMDQNVPFVTDQKAPIFMAGPFVKLLSLNKTPKYKWMVNLTLMRCQIRYAPVAFLTASECDWILCELSKHYALKIYHICLLFHPDRKTLDLTNIKLTQHKQWILDLALLKCNTLKELKLNFCRDFTDIFTSNPKIFQSVTHLDLADSGLTDHDLGLIGAHLIKVKYLDINNCHFGENGLRSLFMPNDPYGRKDDTFGKCQDIEFLDIRSVDISARCAAEIYALRKEKWKVFKVDYGFRVAMVLWQEMRLVEFKTDDLTDTFKGLNEESVEVYLQAAVSLAPGVKSVHIYNVIVEPYEGGLDLVSLQFLDKIEELTCSFEPFQDLNLVFEMSIKPILSRHGVHLTYLKLDRVNNLDLGLVVSECTQLETLKLESIIYSNYFTYFQIGPNWPLKNFEIRCTAPIYNCPNENLLIKILSGAKRLENLRIANSDIFNDRVISESSKSNPFHHLHNLKILFCNSISMKSLEEFLLKKTDVPIGGLVLFNCGQITETDILNYKKYLLLNNYQMRIIFQESIPSTTSYLLGQ